MSVGLSLSKATGDNAAEGSASLDASAQVHQYLTFTLGFDRFGVPILSVLEIIEYEPPAPVPGLPSLFSGIINLREAAVPVIELATCLNRSVETVSKRTCILIVETVRHAVHRRVGFVVDSVSEVVDIPEKLIDPPPVLGSMSAEPYLIGTGRIEDAFVVLIDFDPLIAMYAGESLEALPAT